MGTVTIKQRGVSISGFLTVVAVLVFLAISGMKLIPAYIQDKTIRSKFYEVAHDPDLQNSPANVIRSAFSKRVTVTDITALKTEDIEVTKDASGIILSASYTVKIPIFGNASLLLEFNPSSANP